MPRLNKLVTLLLSTIFVVGVISIVTTPVKKNEMDVTSFEYILNDVQSFYKDAVGYDVRTPIRPFVQFGGPGANGNVLAYCSLQPGNNYIAFNHAAIDIAKVHNPDFVFQVILHEYTHCEGAIGHIEMWGHFMNDGGAPWLNKAQVKEQFVDYLKYYRAFFKKNPVYPMDRDNTVGGSDYAYAVKEDDVNKIHALKIWVDSDGNVKTSCTCSTCTK